MFQYLDILEHIMEHGERKISTRGGVDTLGVFNYNYTHDVGKNGIPLLTTKKISWKNIVIENLWFLSGEPTVDFLHKHDVHFWDPWIINEPVMLSESPPVFNGEADALDLPISEPRITTRKVVPSAYGNFWRRFSRPVTYFEHQEGLPFYIDQVKWAIDLLKSNPATRQACITSWDPRNVVGSSIPPCHVFHVLNIHAKRGDLPRLNLHLTQRSCDVALGLPFNMAGYGGFLLPLYARFVGYEPGVFAHSIVDMHVYTACEDGSKKEYDHFPGLAEQLSRNPRPLPSLKISDKIQSLQDIDDLVKSNASTEEILDLFKLEDYHPHPAISFKVAV
jgi:thymidylate synthase